MSTKSKKRKAPRVVPGSGPVGLLMGVTIGRDAFSPEGWIDVRIRIAGANPETYLDLRKLLESISPVGFVMPEKVETTKVTGAKRPVRVKGRFMRPGEVGFAGMVTFHCPVHGDVISCACSPKSPL